MKLGIIIIHFHYIFYLNFFKNYLSVGKSELLRIYSKLLNSSKEYNPNTTNFLFEYLETILPKLEIQDAILLANCRNIMNKKKLFYEKIVDLISMLAKSFQDQVVEIIFNWEEGEFFFNPNSIVFIKFFFN